MSSCKQRHLFRFSAGWAISLASITLLLTATAYADEVTDWNKVMNDTILTAKANPLVSSRVVAIVSASVYDSVNGIEQRYTPVHVDFAAPPGASKRAAAVEAAYTALVTLFPAQKSALDAQRAASLASINSSTNTSESIARGLQWGQAVANDIMAWRSTDGFTPPPPPFLGGNAIGQWRPTPPDFSSGAGPQFATMEPWVISSPSQFRPAGPPALPSADYAAVFNETKSMGRATGSPRTADQTLLAVFWTGNTPLYWNRIARATSLQRHLTLSENSRLFAMLNIAMADAAIACWDAKYHYQFWRPITAITNADMDGNASTDLDLAWTPLLGITPAHPEYPSGHSTVSSSAAGILAAYFGDDTAITIDSEVTPGVLRSFTSFSNTVEEIHNARVFGGIHFRSACVDGSVVGYSVAGFVLQHAFLSLNGRRFGQVTHTHATGTVDGQGQVAENGTL